MCTALQLGGDAEQPWFMTSSIKPEIYNLPLRRQRPSHRHEQTNCQRSDVQFRRYYRGLTNTHADRQTHTHRHAHHNTPLPYWGRSNQHRPNHCIDCIHSNVLIFSKHSCTALQLRLKQARPILRGDMRDFSCVEIVEYVAK